MKGLGIAAGARRPGAKKKTAAPAATPAKPAQPEPDGQPQAQAEAAPEPESDAPSQPASGNGDVRVVGDEPPVKGLGIAKGARRPGKR